MNNIVPIHIRELNTIRQRFPNYFEEHTDGMELDRLYHKWIPLLSTYVTHDSIEAAIDDWYALIKHSHIWIHYIEKTQANMTRPIVAHALESWKQPFVFAGTRTKNDSFQHWSDESEWTLLNLKGDHIIGIALPFPEKNNAIVQHYFEATDEFFAALEDDFKNSQFASKQIYLNETYLSCLAHLSH